MWQTVTSEQIQPTVVAINKNSFSSVSRLQLSSRQCCDWHRSLLSNPLKYCRLEESKWLFCRSRPKSFKVLLHVPTHYRLVPERGTAFKLSKSYPSEGEQQCSNRERFIVKKDGLFNNGRESCCFDFVLIS